MIVSTPPDQDDARLCAAIPVMRKLTSWRRAAGYDPDEDGAGKIRSTGESNAALDRLKRQLADLDVTYHWCDDCQEYHLQLLPPPSTAKQDAANA